MTEKANDLKSGFPRPGWCLYGVKVKQGWGWFRIRKTNGMVALTPTINQWPMRVVSPWYIPDGAMDHEKYEHHVTTMIYFPFDKKKEADTLSDD